MVYHRISPGFENGFVFIVPFHQPFNKLGLGNQLKLLVQRILCYSLLSDPCQQTSRPVLFKSSLLHIPITGAILKGEK